MNLKYISYKTIVYLGLFKSFTFKNEIRFKIEPRESINTYKKYMLMLVYISL